MKCKSIAFAKSCANLREIYGPLCYGTFRSCQIALHGVDPAAVHAREEAGVRDHAVGGPEVLHARGLLRFQTTIFSSLLLEIRFFE